MIDGLSNEAGRIGVLAIDHRDSLRTVIDPSAPERVERNEIVELKRVIIGELADLGTGVMLEPEYSIPDLVGDLPEGVGFTAALESQGYSEDPSSVPTELLQGWSSAQAADAGAAATKLLAYYSPAAAEHAALQRSVITQALAESHAAGLPLFLEPLAFPGGDHGPETLEAIKGTLDLGADVMKVAWPGEAYLEEMAQLLEGRTWVLLSGGGDFDAYVAQIRAAISHGCSGVMAGRAVWREVTQVAPEDRVAELQRVARPRFERLQALLAD